MANSDQEVVRHRPGNRFDYGTLREDAATFYVGNKVYEGFKSIKISSSLTNLSGTFEIVITDRWEVNHEDFGIKPGSRIHCHLGKAPIFEGYVDKLLMTITPESRNITIAGRERTADLIDCDIVGNSEYTDVNIVDLATILCKPFGIKVILNASGPEFTEKFSKFSAKKGESIFEVLERASKQRKVILRTTAHGNLLLEKKGNSRASTELIEGVNIIDISAEFDNSERFSEYHIAGQNNGIFGDEEDAIHSSGTAYDKGISRYRPKNIVAENAVDSGAAQSKAEWEASFRAAKACQVNVLLEGWKEKNGTLWATNKIVSVTSPKVGLRKQKMLIKGVKFDQGDDGRKVELELIRPDAFDFKIEVKKEDDPLDILGWSEKK